MSRPSSFFLSILRPLFRACAALLILSAINYQPSAFAQGPLTPPAAPTPTMKTLDQLEPRSPISSLPATLSASGSYYLTKNLTSTDGTAITISGSGVTLDLGGFTINCTAASQTGQAIAIVGAIHDIIIKDGHIVSGITYGGSSFTTGPGFFAGITVTDVPTNVLITNVTVSGCGGGGGIVLGGASGTVIKQCSVSSTSGGGISADLVLDSTAQICGGTGISGHTVTNCTADSKNGDGISGTLVANSYATATGAHSGIAVGNGMVTTSFGQSATGNGISGGIVSYSRGVATGSGNGILAGYIIGCSGASGAGGTALNGTKVYSFP